MRTSVKLCFTALTAAILLASAVSSSSAGRLEVNNQRFRVVWSSLEFASPLVTIRCKVTLEGTFHERTIQKVERTLIGAVTRAIVHTPSCTNGKGWAENGVEVAPLGTLANTLPWHVTYENFNGILPNIEAINLLLSRFRFVIEAAGCIARYGTATDNVTGRASREGGGAIRELTPVEGRNTVNLVNSLAGLCPGSGRFRTPAGDGRVTVLGETGRIFVTLI